jgi:hypothetical protein
LVLAKQTATGFVFDAPVIKGFITGYSVAHGEEKN